MTSVLRELELRKEGVGIVNVICDVPEGQEHAKLKHIEFGEYLAPDGERFPLSPLGVTTLLRLAGAPWQAKAIARMFAG